jgi:hypothetical protein
MNTHLHRLSGAPVLPRGLRLTPALSVVRTLGLLTAVLFAIDAYVHFNNAHGYDFDGGASITQGNLFRVQASVAVVVALALLIRPHWGVWVAALVVAASATGAVFLYTYVNVGRFGPLPNMYEPTWDLPGKLASAVAESIATGFSLVGLWAALHARRATPFRGSRRPRLGHFG